MKNILILGANSGIARALARQLAGPEVQLVLAGRNVEEMEKSAADLEIRGRGPKPKVKAFDALALETHTGFAAALRAELHALDQVYVFFGLLHDQRAAENDLRLALEMLSANYTGAVSVLENLAPWMAQTGSGVIVGISSVAGDRGRQSNYFYGSAKAGFSAYLQGLRNRLFRAGVHVLTVKPGFVDTAMTRYMKKGMLFAKAETVAAGIIKAVSKKKDVVYVPGYWRWIMAVVCAVPEGIFKKLKL